MIKQTISYTDFDNNEQTETLYFNIMKSEIMSLDTDVTDRLRKITEMLQGGERELQPEEVREIVDLVKLLIKLSYGIRSEDGRRFKKSAEIWEDFSETAAYDEFFTSLFLDTNKAVNFLTGILPKDLLEQAKAEQEKLSPQAQAAQAAINQATAPQSVAPVQTETPQPPFAKPSDVVPQAAPSWFGNQNLG